MLEVWTLDNDMNDMWFTVTKEWALNWFKANPDCCTDVVRCISIELWNSNYTADDSWVMYCAAKNDGAVMSERRW